jgi:tRNA(Ile)-lysidine synthase TilS/MesJ
VDETNFTDKYTRNRIRKMMNEWDEEKYNNFKSEVSKYNDEQKNKRDKIDEIFLAWKQTNYSAKFFKNTDSEFHYYLLYLW